MGADGGVAFETATLATLVYWFMSDVVTLVWLAVRCGFHVDFNIYFNITNACRWDPCTLNILDIRECFAFKI